MSQKSDKAGKASGLARLGGWLVLGTVLGSFVGCTSTQGHVKGKGEPLFGEIHGPGTNGLGINPPATQPANHTKTSAVPPIPTTNGSVSNAALAALDGSRSLAIAANPPAAPFQPAAFVPAPVATPASSGGGPRVMPLPRDSSPPAVLTTGSFSANQQTDDLLLTQLRSRGVLMQKQELVPEGVKFTCIVPSANNPDQSQVYVAIAPDYATAVQSVLLQIDRQK